jgi:flagellar biosynthetic protein FliP
MRNRFALKTGLALGFLALAAMAIPQTVPSVSLQIGPQKGSGDVATTLQILALLTVLSLAPAILMLTTAFTRIVIIFSFLRSAMGTPSIPPNQVLIGLSLFLTFFVMQPTWDKVYTQAIKPLSANQKGFGMEQAIKAGEGPIREFMLKSTYESDLKLFLDLRDQHPRTPQEVDVVSLIPAFMISELKTAFMIGFYIYIPFLIIDLIVASSLMSMGMMMMPPTVVSLPAKLLVFVLADGWATLIHAILQGYR